jgi:formate dehydrogenase iron-sulfur subunit
MACPYGIPRYEWDSPVPYVRKCILCAEYIARGEKPACTEACPTGATIFGRRDDLLVEAHRRIDSEPGKYLNAVWGEKEIGGGGVLYVSDTDLSFLNYGRPLGDQSLPSRTAPAMQAVPFAFAGMAAAMAGVGWIISRRRKLNEKQVTEPKDEHE